MGRGADDKVTAVVGRKNPFRQEIKSKDQLDRERQEEEKKLQQIRTEEAVRKREEEKRRWDEEEKERILEMEKERDERRSSYSKENLTRIEKRQRFLESRGLAVFDPGSPGEEYVEGKELILPEDYLQKIEKLTDPLLTEDGKNFAYRVSDRRREEIKGFSKSEAEAQEIIDTWIEANIAKRIEILKEKEDEFLAQEKYERQKRAKEKMLSDLPISRWHVVDHQQRKRHERISIAKRLFDERTTDIKREEISGFEIITYQFEGRPQIVAFKDDDLAFQTSIDDKLVPLVRVDGRLWPGEPVALLPKRKNEEELRIEALIIAEEKHGPAPFAGGLPGITRGRREKKEREFIAREETRKEALQNLIDSEDERMRQEMLAQARDLIKKILARQALESI